MKKKKKPNNTKENTKPKLKQQHKHNQTQCPFPDVTVLIIIVNSLNLQHTIQKSQLKYKSSSIYHIENLLTHEIEKGTQIKRKITQKDNKENNNTDH